MGSCTRLDGSSPPHSSWSHPPPSSHPLRTRWDGYTHLTRTQQLPGHARSRTGRNGAAEADRTAVRHDDTGWEEGNDDRRRRTHPGGTSFAAAATAATKAPRELTPARSSSARRKLRVLRGHPRHTMRSRKANWSAVGGIRQLSRGRGNQATPPEARIGIEMDIHGHKSRRCGGGRRALRR